MGPRLFIEGEEDAFADLVPALLKGAHDDRFDEQEDVFGGGVVGADEGAALGVEGTLEGAEDAVGLGHSGEEELELAEEEVRTETGYRWLDRMRVRKTYLGRSAQWITACGGGHRWTRGPRR